MPWQGRVTGTCAVGSSIRQVNADGTVVCQVDTNSGGTVTSVSTGSGLTGGPITTSGTIGVDPARVQLRVTGSCAAGDAMQAVQQNGSVTCQGFGSGTVTAVTASAPLASSGGATPDISLPHVIVSATNTAIGDSALQSNTTGSFNTASGVSALSNNTTGLANTAMGDNALANNTFGAGNTAIGVGALFKNNSDQNTAIGNAALGNNTTGLGNTAIGVNTLESNSTGNLNSASGHQALMNNTTGAGNTASGATALHNNTTGSFNTASGKDALHSNTTGQWNTAGGHEALFFNSTGFGNTAIGALALRKNGSNITVIGAFADAKWPNLVNATAIGANAVVDDSNKIRLGNSLVTVIEGQVPFTFTSDRNEKENFQSVDGEAVLKKLSGMSVTSWNYLGHDPRRFRHYGPVAQEFFAAFGHDGIGTVGTSATINSGDLEGILMIAVQALEQRTAEVTQLKARLEALERLVLVAR